MLMSSHKARHNFGTHITLSLGVPIETVSRMMGHKSISTTQIYAKVTDRKVDEDMKRLKEQTKGRKINLYEEDEPETADIVILSADLAVIFFKYQTSSSSINRSSNGLLILLLKVSAMWTYLSVVLMLLCPISSFTILMSVPCSSKWVANEWRSRCG